jgi:hypothetical protein
MYNPNSLIVSQEWIDFKSQIYLNGSVGNRIEWRSVGVAPPSVATRSVGTKILLHTGLNPTDSDYALGISPYRSWYSVTSASGMHKGYCGSTLIGAMGTGGLHINNRIYTYQTGSIATNTNTTLTSVHSLTGICTCTSSNVIDLTLPNGTVCQSGMLGGTRSLNQGFEWSIINTGSSVGVVTLASSSPHSIVSNSAFDINQNAR